MGKQYAVFNKVLLDTRTGLEYLKYMFGADMAIYTIIPEIKRNGYYEDQFHRVTYE